MNAEDRAKRRTIIQWALIAALVLVGVAGYSYRIGASQSARRATTEALKECEGALEYAEPVMWDNDRELLERRALLWPPGHAEVDR